MNHKAPYSNASWLIWVTGCLLLLVTMGGCDFEQARSEESLNQPVEDEQDLVPGSTASPTPNKVSSVAAYPTEFSPSSFPTAVPTESAPTPLPTLVPSPTPIREAAIYVPDILREETIAAINLPNFIDGNWDWKFTDELGEANIVIVEGSGQINAGEQSIALIVPFTSPMEGLPLVKAEEYLLNPSGEITLSHWDEIPAGFKALRIDGYLPYMIEYPLKQYWSVNSSAEYEIPAHAIGMALRQELSNARTIHIAAVGDIMLDRSLGHVIESGDLSYPFAEVREALDTADITVGNLESSLGDIGEPVAKSYNFQAPPKAAESLALAGFDVMSLANNHAMDFGSEALIQAIDLLARSGMAAVGAGSDYSDARKPVILEEAGIRIAFLAYVDVPVEVTGFDTRTWEAGAESTGLAWAYPNLISQDVRTAQANSDVVVVLLHSGYEFLQDPSPPQIASARAAIDAGASLVISHHSHLLQGVEFYKDGVIAYGLSNFAFDMDGSPDSAILNVWLDGEGVHHIEFVPVSIGPWGQPALAMPIDSQRIRDEIYRLTRLLNQP